MGVRVVAKGAIRVNSHFKWIRQDLLTVVPPALLLCWLGDLVGQLLENRLAVSIEGLEHESTAIQDHNITLLGTVVDLGVTKTLALNRRPYRSPWLDLWCFGCRHDDPGDELIGCYDLRLWLRASRFP